MIYCAKIRRMSKRRRKIAVRRKLRALLRAERSPFIGQRVGRETMERIKQRIGELIMAPPGYRGMAADFGTSLHDYVLDMHVFVSPVTHFINVPVRIRLASPLKTELANLRRNYDRDEDKLARASRDFWSSGGVCCPSCGVRGYGELQLKQERRLKRMDEIRAYLQRHGGVPEGGAA